MRAMLVDDEQPSLDELAFLLSRHADAEIVGAYLSPLEALVAVGRLMPDVVFLDQVMPRMTGAELAEKILAQIPTARLIFVTAFVGELAAVKNVPLFGSLLKPVSEAKLGELLDRLRTSPPL